jgi:hypothetical protein
VASNLVELTRGALTDVVVNIPFGALPVVLPFEKIGGFVNTVVTSHGVIVILHMDVVSKRKVFRNCQM